MGLSWEIGGGYGRTAYIFLKLHPKVRDILTDIEPAATIQLKYLRSQFPKANIISIPPKQLRSIPKNIDLAINISSFQEMTKDTKDEYLNVIGKVAKHAYLKEWKNWHNEDDNVTLSEEDYHLDGWKEIAKKDCPFLPGFFEALYRTN